ncbi:hypothetical protein GWI33_023364 [Rhynchophorus ferrugineus]|uniref:Uncharacterized protein n=1 Tax=Rhynchophorus ferrugineus TaxID=354439 RepID=A0A834IZR4_RHYFE|nr:hypothetical protein GWI33_023364 [Rhynchophorus ferrugineus]
MLTASANNLRSWQNATTINISAYKGQQMVCEKCSTRKHPSRELFRSESFLEMILYPSHFHNGRLTLKCVAQIGDLYQQDTDVTFTNVKDPIPARVTQTTSGNGIQKHSSSMSIIIYSVIIYLYVS